LVGIGSSVLRKSAQKQFFTEFKMTENLSRRSLWVIPVVFVIFVEHVQADLYAKFLVNPSLAKKTVGTNALGGARETFFYTLIRKLNNLKMFTSLLVHVEFQSAGSYRVRPDDV